MIPWRPVNRIHWTDLIRFSPKGRYLIVDYRSEPLLSIDQGRSSGVLQFIQHCHFNNYDSVLCESVFCS